MGRATRWFKGLLGMKKERDQSSSSISVSSRDSKLEKRRWSTGKSSKDPNAALNIPRSSDPAWHRSYFAETEEEQNRHAIAVAAATAAAADAAVAAAQAAVAVVRLTSQGRGVKFGVGGGGGGKEGCAAVKIQTVFRGYLARKALRALKGLVKLQALVRGYLIRKRAAATLHSIQALIRAQAAVRSQRISLNKENMLLPENRPHRSIERFDETRSEFHSKRLSASYDTPTNGFDGSPKIVEIDTVKPQSRSRRMNNVLVECSEDLCYHGISSPLAYPLPARLSVPDSHHLQDYDLYYPVDECRFSTAQSTPRFANSLKLNIPATPAKSICGDSYFQPYSNSPNYMSNTQSFKAKLRSHSAPKQRPVPEPVSAKKRLPLNEIMASRNSVSGIRMQRPFSYLHEVLNYY